MLKLNFQNNKVVKGKTPFFVIGQLYTSHSIFLTLGLDNAVLYGSVQS